MERNPKASRSSPSRDSNSTQRGPPNGEKRAHLTQHTWDSVQPPYPRGLLRGVPPPRPRGLRTTRRSGGPSNLKGDPFQPQGLSTWKGAASRPPQTPSPKERATERHAVTVLLMHVSTWATGLLNPDCLRRGMSQLPRRARGHRAPICRGLPPRLRGDV